MCALNFSYFCSCFSQRDAAKANCQSLMCQTNDFLRVCKVTQHLHITMKDSRQNKFLYDWNCAFNILRCLKIGCKIEEYYHRVNSKKSILRSKGFYISKVWRELFKVKKKRKLNQNSKLLAIYHYTSPRKTETNCSTLSLRVYVTHVPKGFLVTKWFTVHDSVREGRLCTSFLAHPVHS